MFADAPFPVQVVVFLVIVTLCSPLIYAAFWLFDTGIHPERHEK
jgi:hypothetical protein